MGTASTGKSSIGPASLEEILITRRLHETSSRAPNLQEEGKALRTLARTLATKPREMIDGLLEMALQLCKAGTAGLSVLETLPGGEQVFRWINMAGRLKRFTGGSAPRNFSLCRVCLDCNAPQLFAYPARRFRYLSEAVDAPIVQALMIPVPLGLGESATIWILAHEEGTNFDAEDVRIMSELADFTGCALGLIHSREAAEKARNEAEMEIVQRRSTEAQLRAAKQSLEQALDTQYEACKQREIEIAERKRTAEVLQKNQLTLESLVETRTSQLRQLSAKLLILQDEERRRIARELHDSAGQYLSGIQMNLDACMREDSTTWAPRIVDSKALAERCLSEIRTISYLLHPPLLDEVGLVSALSWYAEGFSQRCGIQVDIKVAPDDLGRLPSEVETAIFRVVQQALSNIHRHSGSKTAQIVMSADAEQVMCVIRDEGCGIPSEVLTGFSTGAQLPGVGLAGMRERISNMGGKFSIRSSGHGTTLELSLPRAPKQSAAAGANTRGANARGANARDANARDANAHDAND
ncbi:MAG TPA: ATP-binding protein [Candidatus Acidoferrales bacterium]|nr:ATP-binding protein [Candidatus Acidoferrales bacterium]